MMATDDRLQRLLGGETLARLRSRLRQRFERSAARTALAGFRLTQLSAAEHQALAALQGRPARFSASMQIDVALIDEALRRAGIAESLRAGLEQLDGPIVDRAAERLAAQALWLDVLAASRCATLGALLETPAGSGLLKRLSNQNPAFAARLIAGTEATLRQLPACGVTRAQLAARVLGDAHALDNGRPVATLVLAVLRSTPADEASRAATAATDDLSTRDLWAAAGVLVNELARPALVLNLPGMATPGEPAYLSLRRLLRTPPEWMVHGRTVYVCENPNLLAIAADHLGTRCAPLVCTEGMPAAAQRTLLAQLAQAGAVLRYHGDFDWPGLAIANHVLREHGANPWRFCAADYQAALAIAPHPGHLLTGAEVEASWDATLCAAMRKAQQAIDEEMVAELLLRDLAPLGA